jgi:hypothetical protein
MSTSELVEIFAVHVYNKMPIRCLKWRTPYEELNRAKPDVSHLQVFGCGASVFIPEDVRVNKLTPRAEVMTFLGYLPGMKGFKFMRKFKPNNIIFHSATALFDEYMFPHCQTSKVWPHVPG